MIQQASRILCLTDEYDELLSGYQSGNPQTVRGALRSLYVQGKKGALEAELVGKFIKPHRDSSHVQLSRTQRGERGIVMANSRENLLHPTILLIQVAAHQLLSEPIPFYFFRLGNR